MEKIGTIRIDVYGKSTSIEISGTSDMIPPLILKVLLDVTNTFINDHNDYDLQALRGTKELNNLIDECFGKQN